MWFYFLISFIYTQKIFIVTYTFSFYFFLRIHKPYSKPYFIITLDPGQTTSHLLFTIRDSLMDYINVICRGTKEFIERTKNIFHTGDFGKYHKLYKKTCVHKLVVSKNILFCYQYYLL